MDTHIQKVNDIEQSDKLYQQVAILQENVSKTNNQSDLNYNSFNNSLCIISEIIQSMDDDNIHVSDEVKKLQEKICTLGACKDSEVINLAECHDLEVTNNNTIQQLQQDIALLKVNYCITVHISGFQEIQI